MGEEEEGRRCGRGGKGEGKRGEGETWLVAWWCVVRVLCGVALLVHEWRTSMGGCGVGMGGGVLPFGGRWVWRLGRGEAGRGAIGELGRAAC